MRTESDSPGRKVGWQAAPKTNLKTHALKGVAKSIPNYNLHLQLTPCTTSQNQRDTNKTSVWVPGGCLECGPYRRSAG
jgi:hypothetical protein